ncbi:hypothetical protein F2P56_000468 [Juglans regia]|uniref:Endonuclease/exonuclease/phosphatase domain-containing protein n=1 Tax=Juglans regia TaxID=51240 RepID=A0A833YAL0_JUGRE|nr:hypothetical protein F2P56_000468 [Juglans regia]
MKHKILSWNVRGLNKVEKRLRIRRLLREWKADIVCLQETKLKLISRRIIRSLWSNIYVDWVYLVSSGASGGVVIMWDRRVVEKVEEYIGRYMGYKVGETSLGVLGGISMWCASRVKVWEVED